MANHVNLAACNPVAPPLRMEHVSAVTEPPAVPGSDTDVGSAGALAPRPLDLAAIEQFLQLLARAVHQYRTYPATSPLCVDAIAACHKALVSHKGREQMLFRVTPRELLLDEHGIGAGTIVEHELVGRLHRSRVSTLSIEQAASPRDLSRFCCDLTAAPDGAHDTTTLDELLVEHGVDTITARMAYRPEVLDLGAPPSPLCALVESERRRRQPFATGEPITHLYPPDKGWVRLDPAARFDAISLADLAVLVEDPARLAAMLLRLTDGETGAAQTLETALEREFSSVAMLFASLEPQLARMLFPRLARAVLGLEPARRQELLRRTILPGLLDGQIDGMILRDFTDIELVESLLLLLDLETAKPELLWKALDCLELPAERRHVIATLLKAEVRARTGAGPATNARGDDPALDRDVRQLMRVKAAGGKAFVDFGAFDLSIDAEAREAMARIPSEIRRTDFLAAKLRCLSMLVRHESNSTMVERFLGQAFLLLGELERASRWQDIAAWLARQQQIVQMFHETRPDVADAIAAALRAFWTSDRTIRLAELYKAEGEAQAAAAAFVAACGANIAPAWVALLEDSAGQSSARSLLPLMCEHATQLAPELSARLGDVGNPAARALVKVLGFAGPGFESALAEQVRRGDEQTTREALRALARIGTAKAAALVAEQVRSGSPWVRSVAEEALWRCPHAQAEGHIRDLLSQREFALRNPKIAARLLERAAGAGTAGLSQALRALAPLRFRFWSPALARVGAIAHDMARR